MQKLYLLKEREDNKIKTDIGAYDTYDGFVIRAKNEKEARSIARDKEYDQCAIDWENPEITSCEVITGRGETGIVLYSYNAG